MNIFTKLAQIALSCFLFLAFAAVADEPAIDSAARADELAERQAAIAEAQAVLEAAQSNLAAASDSLARSRAEHSEGLEQMREELSRAHRQMQEASRDVARVHRGLLRAEGEGMRWQVINLGDRAVLGVVLGEETQAGIPLIGVSPDGPAERAGLRQDDILTAIAGVDLTRDQGGRANLMNVMDSAKAGEELPVTALRGGEILNVIVVPEQREPSSWQSMIHLPDHPHIANMAPTVHIERIEVPEFDEEEWAARVEEFNQRAKEFEYRFSGENGEEFAFAGDFEFDADALSDLGEHAMHEANMWFGMPQTRGLELASLNPELGKYFKADSGVLVIQAREDNAYGLQSGDVIQAIDATEVNSPADFLRALRDAEPGVEVELTIKRDRRERTLKSIVPENRLGHLQHQRLPHAPVAPAAPVAPKAE